jgi:hypothetical protein
MEKNGTLAKLQQSDPKLCRGRADGKSVSLIEPANI